VSKQIVLDVDYYYDVDGFMVLTESYHLEKGVCCGHGCRHCPYQFENVPEPRKSEIILELKLAENRHSSNL